MNSSYILEEDINGQVVEKSERDRIQNKNMLFEVIEIITKETGRWRRCGPAREQMHHGVTRRSSWNHLVPHGVRAQSNPSSTCPSRPKKRASYGHDLCENESNVKGSGE